MPTLGTQKLTLVDWAKRVDPDGKVGAVVEMLSQTNQMLMDMTFMEGNLPTGHRVVMRTGLPAVYWRAYNQGVPDSKSTTAQIDESVGMLEAYSEPDKALLELNGNGAEMRLSEDRAFIESMNQEAQQKLLYGDSVVDPKLFVGFAPRYSAISGAGNAQNILDAGGTSSNNTSLWLACWGPETVFGIFPKGSKAGLQHHDLGEDTVYDANGGRYQALRTHYKWTLGLVVKDWRYVVRVCNINTANLVAQSGAADLSAFMSRALDRIPAHGMGQCVFYVNRTVYSALKIQALNKSQNVLSIEKALDQFGRSFTELSFLGTPIRQVDAILNTEARVV